MSVMEEKIRIVLNLNFFYKLRPENVMKYGIIFFFIILIIAPIRINGELTFDAFSYIVLNIIAFTSGCLLIKVERRVHPFLEFYVDQTTLKKVYTILFRLAIFAIVMKIIDNFFIRGISWSATTLENMDSISEASGNLYSILASIFVFTTYLPITIDYLAEDLNSKSTKIISQCLFWFNCLDCLSTGSRFMLVRPIVYFLLLLGVTGKYAFLNKKSLTIGIVIGIFVVNAIGSMMLRRLNDMGLSEFGAIEAAYGGAAKTVPVKSSYRDLMKDSKNDWYYVYLYSFVNICQYETHAVFEFPAVKNFVDQKNDLLYGRSTFMVYDKFFNKIWGNGKNIQTEINEHNLRPGIWSTFFFSWYLDFGWFGIVVFFIMGFISKYLWLKVYEGLNILYIPITLFMSMVWALTLQLNYIQGSGTYALTTFLLIPLLFNLYNIRLLPNDVKVFDNSYTYES